MAWPSIDDYEDVSSRNQYHLALDSGKTEAEALDCVHDTGRDNARTHGESRPGTLRPLEAVACIARATLHSS